MCFHYQCYRIKCTEITDVGVLQVAKMLGQNSTIEEMG